MTLPPFQSLGHEYHRGDRGGDSRPVPGTERYHRVHELRQKFGEYILGEALHVASKLRAKRVEPEIDIVDTVADFTFRGRGLVPLRKTKVTHTSEVRAHYRGWKLVQARWALGDYVRPSSDRGGSMPTVTPGHVACRGIALLTDGRLMPYDASNDRPEAMPDWRVDDAWKHKESMGWAIVQEDQITERDQYSDIWPMHKDMRDENGRWAATHPTWVLTAPGPNTLVYGRGIREGLATLARCNEIVIPERIEPVQRIGDRFAHNDGAVLNRFK